MTAINRIADTITEVVMPVYVLRAPLIVSAACAGMLAWPAQTLEIYRAIALDHVNKGPQILLAFVTLFLAGTLIWYLGRNLTLRWQKNELVQPTLSGVLLRWGPRILGALPLFGAATGLWQAGQNIKRIVVPDFVRAQMPASVGPLADASYGYDVAQKMLYYGAGIAAALGVVLILITFLRAYRMHWKYEQPNPWLFSLPVRLGFHALNLGLVIAFSAFFIGAPVNHGLLADSIGAFAIFNIFMICLVFFLCALTNLYDATRFPALSLIVICAIGATAFNLNDNHGIRFLPRSTLPLLPGAKESFEAWLRSRPDLAYFQQRNEPYPIYIVAAQGGGLYAAYHSALTLARMQDRCPAFAQHVFAISGVSGGSLGSAVFTSLVNTLAKPVTEPDCLFGEQNPGRYEESVKKFLSRDFLSPLAAAGLFPDFLQRFLPVPVAAFDRARALEASFESAWAETAPSGTPNLFSQSYLNHWNAKGLAPALVLNATHVETGNRVLLAPFRFFRESTTRLNTINSITRADMPLSTAVGISARFPWILPPASYRRGPDTQFRFVDGGYFESSGIDTALDLMTVIEDHLAELPDLGRPVPNVRLNLVAMSTDDILEDPDKSSPYAASVAQQLVEPRGFDEAYSPVKTLMNTRWQRGVVSMARAFSKLCPNCYTDRHDRRTYAGIDGDARLFRLNFTDYSLTLGWQLSHISESIIEAHSGYAGSCLAAVPSLRQTMDWSARVLNENNCSACAMMYSLTGRSSELDQIGPSVTKMAGGFGASRSIAAQAELPSWTKLCRADAASPRVPTITRPEARK